MGSQAKRVGVIGAGVSGVTAAKHLKEQGLEVVVFERSSVAGGNWSYDERKSLEPKYPTLTASGLDDVETESTDFEIEELRFAPPGPAYAGLTNNVSIKLQGLKGFPWKEGIGEDFVTVFDKQEYIQSYAKAFGVEEIIRYNTRVDRLEKKGEKWELSSTTLVREGTKRGEKIHKVDLFDFVVVASGHYHASRIPDIPGLVEWKKNWPERLQHSKSYRRPKELKDQNILLVGAGVSSTDIAREAVNVAKKVYQSSRGGAFDAPVNFLPPGVDRVAGIASFEIPSEEHDNPGAITLVDGTVLHDIDRVIFATGYFFSLPFLPTLHDDLTPREQANETVLVTDGSQVHNLHKDIFYIPDPTLALTGTSAYVATFTHYEFQAIAVAAVFSGRASLPSKSEMRAEYEQKVKEKGYGRAFHNLREGEVEYVQDLVEWLNKEAAITGGENIEAHSIEWVEERKLVREKIFKSLQYRFGKS